MRDVRGAVSKMNSDQKARGHSAGCLSFLVLFLAISLASGCQTGGDGQSVAGDPGSEKATSNPTVSTKTESPAGGSSSSKASRPVWKPVTAKERAFHRNIISSIGTPKELKQGGIPLKKVREETPNVYWGTMCYVGLGVEGDEVHVALRNSARIPLQTLRDLPRWYGNMAGDMWAYREYTWVLVDYKTAKPLVY
ncbi:hypothetical protein GCM10009546_69910 [Actinomadura livida]|uniref:Lipoprotein n=1 Tax=Actinomadura livida TaxID=79909 RepID=A0ABN1FU34_9ACTN|nr:hypothetical protein GCM10010208_00880 [Actinomadura livida]